MALVSRSYQARVKKITSFGDFRPNFSSLVNSFRMVQRRAAALFYVWEINDTVEVVMSGGWG